MLWTPPKSYATRAATLSLSGGQAVSRSVSQSLSRTVGQPVDQYVGQSVSHGQLVGRSVSQSFVTVALDQTYGYRTV